MPKVAVIISTYNRSAFLKRAIESVCGQTYTDFEIIVVDDASTDDTPGVVAQFRDKPIKYIRHDENKGGSASRNTGISKSQSDYIAFLDDDDEWLPEKLARQVSVLDAGDKLLGGVCTGHFNVDDKSGAITGEWIPSHRGNLSKKILETNCLSTTSSLLLKKETFETVGLFDEQLKSFQDYDMWVRIAQHYTFDYIKDPLVKYYWHPIQIWKNLNALSQGVDRILKKHGGYWGVRKRMSGRYLYIGVRYCMRGQYREGRKSFFKAIKANPIKFENYSRLLLSLFGPPTMKGLKEWGGSLKLRLFKGNT